MNAANVTGPRRSDEQHSAALRRDKLAESVKWGIGFVVIYALIVWGTTWMLDHGPARSASSHPTTVSMSRSSPGVQPFGGGATRWCEYRVPGRTMPVYYQC